MSRRRLYGPSDLRKVCDCRLPDLFYFVSPDVMPRIDSRVKGWSTVVLALFFATAQWAWLPPEGWITGDQGAKFLQTRAFALQGPLNPGIEVLAKDVDPHGRYQEPKLEKLRGRLVSEFLWLLPLAGAPFFYALGMRGLYVVPALSVLVIFLAAAALGKRLGQPTGVLSGWVAIVATPALVFGAELWEHAPAAACVIVAAALVAPGREGKGSETRLALAGAAVMTGFLFREEVVAALPALALARWAATPSLGVRGPATCALWMLIGAGAVFIASIPMNFLMYGAPLPMHVTHDAWDVIETTPYVATRWEILRSLVPPARYVPHYLAAAAAGLVVALIETWTRRAGASRSGSRARLLIVHGAALIMVATAVGSPLWRLLHGLRVEDSYNVASAAHTWPFIAALFYLPWVVSDTQRPTTRFLLTAAFVIVAVTFLVVPTDGGAQWSPRFLFAAAPLLAIASTPGMRRPSGVSSASICSMVVTVLTVSSVMQLHGLTWLHRAKWDSAGLTRAMAMHTNPGDVIMSNVFWVPELAASLSPTRRMLFYPVGSDFPAASAMVYLFGIRQVTTITSSTLTGYQPPATLERPGQSCRFARDKTVSLPFGLLLTRYACASR